MKTKRLLAAVIIGVAGMLVGACVSVPPPPPPHGGSHGATNAKGYHRNGFDFGAADARRGLPKSASRHWSGVPASFRDEFTHGYNDGFNTNRDAGNAGNYYQTGLSAAQRDRAKGWSYQPSRHFGSVPVKFRDDFTRGYEAGWHHGGAYVPPIPGVGWGGWAVPHPYLPLH